MTTNLSVCHVAYRTRPVYGGAGEQALHLTRALRRHGVAATVLTSNHSQGASREVLEGVEVYRLPAAGPLRLRDKLFALMALTTLLVRRYDIWHFHGWEWPAFLALALGAPWRPPIVVKATLAGTDDPYAIRRQRLGSFKLRLMRRVDLVVGPGRDMAERLRREPALAGRVAAIDNGVDTNRFRPLPLEQRPALRRALGLPDAFIIGYVGRVGRRKGVDILLDAFERLAPRTPVHLCLVGPTPHDGPWTDPAFAAEIEQRLARPAARGRVTLTGQVDNPWAYLQAMDAFVLPSRSEGQPNAVLEAMACRLPCVVMEAGWEQGVIEHGVNGLVFPRDNVTAFTELLERLRMDSALRDQLGASALTTIQERYSIDNTAATYLAQYTELLTKRETRR